MQRPTAQPILQGQIILGAFAVGVVLFAGVTVYLVTSGAMGGPDSTDPIADLGVPSTAAAAILAVFALALPFPVRRFLASRVGRRRETARAEVEQGLIPQELLAASIVGGALAEAPALAATVFGLISGDLTYLVGTAAGVLALLALVPTRSGLERLVDA